MEHTLNVLMFKSGTGFRARCSCGKRFAGATGCNRAGLDYALAALRGRFNDHCGNEKSSIVPERIGEHMMGLA